MNRAAYASSGKGRDYCLKQRWGEFEAPRKMSKEIDALRNARCQPDANPLESLELSLTYYCHIVLAITIAIRSGAGCW